MLFRVGRGVGWYFAAIFLIMALNGRTVSSRVGGVGVLCWGDGENWGTNWSTDLGGL